MSQSKLSQIDSELLRCHVTVKNVMLDKVLSVLQDIETRKRVGGPPCNQCFGPKEDCTCVEPRRCGGCDNETACVCVCVGKHSGRCLVCTGCSSRSTENAKRLAEIVDSFLSICNVAPVARPAMVDIIEMLLKAVDGGKALRVERLRVTLARKMFRHIVAKVCVCLAQLKGIDPSSDSDWYTTSVAILDIREVFVHYRVPAAVIHKEFGRLIAAVCDALTIPEPEEWMAVAPCVRPKAICDLLRSVGCALRGVDSSFLGKWGEMQVGRVVGVMR